ncbi:ATP-binding protein [Nocardia sp. A7]|uniref:ATP-binding protein n=1 Tax=Nocardia sp. A7 TaxID=2789274 RepID=UPI00397BC06A
MNELEYRALARVQFSTALGPDSIWRPQSYHVEELHRAASAEIARAIGLAKDRPEMSPTGFILNGDPGVGKTHLLGWIRQHVQDPAVGGFFFMPKLIDGKSFWDGAVHGVMNRLIDADGGQLRRLLVFLAGRAGYDSERTARIAGPMRPKPTDIDQFLTDLAGPEPQLAYQCQDTLRALVLFRAGGPLRDVGDSYLILRDPLDSEVAKEWGFRNGNHNAQLIFQDLIRLFGAAGPVVIALDQIDAVMADSANRGGAKAANLADSLMKLREETVRTIIIAACIPTTWDYLKTQGLASSTDRFTERFLATALPGAPVAAAVVAGHLAVQYDEVDFTPPYPTWPIAARAFEAAEVTSYTPRRLLQLVAEHVRNCLDRGEIRELGDFADIGSGAEAHVPVPQVDLRGFDSRFATLREAADSTMPLDPANEDEVMAALLKAALQCFVLEQRDRDDLSIDPATATGRALHARLLRTVDPIVEEQEHWSFRAIGHTHHLAVQSRMRSAVIESGIEESEGNRHLTILRNIPFSKGPKTAAMLTDLATAEGSTLPISQDDLRTFTALQQMLAEATPGFDGWLVERAPAGKTQLFRRVFSDLPESVPAHPASDETDSGSHSEIGPATLAVVEAAGPTVTLGRGLADQSEFVIPLELLRKHLVLFASSGSGKTVLLRRLVEEVALHGVSVIVLDVNNDLSRLGDAWQEVPSAWQPGDAEKAERYLAETDVVVWTPRRQVGRPLILNPLPDFGAVLDDPDELRTAVEVAASDLLARSGIARTKAAQARAVLLEALTHFARSGETKLPGLIALLADLPDGVSRVRNAARIAAEMSDGLTVSMINDPLFGGDGEPLDPGALLTPAPGKKARVSVVSCVGLPDPDQRATFVSQLQVALFTYFKTNPAGDQPLGALLVLDEAQMLAPSGKSTPATESTLMLAAQARKYGLGIAYATQAPKGLDNRVVGNTAIQFFGKLGTAVQIQAAKSIAATWGGNVDDIGRLKTGQFYGATEGRAFRKLATPLCLSHHPASPPTEAEVLERARRGQD